MTRVFIFFDNGKKKFKIKEINEMKINPTKII